MNNRLSLLMFTTATSFLTLGCSQTNIPFLSQSPELTQQVQSDITKPKHTDDLKWLHYADPTADANLAIQKQNFNLIAFAGRVTSFPGIGSESSTLQQQCGYQLLASSGDAMRSKNELSLRKQLYQYAATYNLLVAAACQKRNSY
ncbi:MAG: hypothetical protein ACI9LX_000991 [Paraglaciecola sp.]|jgi:hypothetical protein